MGGNIRMVENAFQQNAFQQDTFQHYVISAATYRDRSRAEPVYLVEIMLKNSGPTLYLSDRNILVSSRQYENYIQDITGISGDVNRADSTISNADITIVLKNDKYTSYDYLVEIGDVYPFEGATCLIKEVYLGDDSTPSEVVTIFKGVIDEPQEIDLLSFQCSVSSTMFQKDKQWQVAMIDTTTYPDAYEDVGKLEPFIYGSDILVPAIRVNWGAKTTLKTAIDSAQTTSIELSDSTRFPSSGTLLIDDEEISYTSIASHILAGVTRGVNGTTATGHEAGATIWEKQAQYDSILASHELHNIGDIYAEIKGELLKVTSGVAGLVSGGKHYLRATSQIKIQVLKDEVVVSDTIDVEQGNHGHSLSGSPGVYYGNSASHSGSNVNCSGVDANLYDQNLGTYVYCVTANTNYDSMASFTVNFPTYSGGTPTAVYKCIHYQIYGTNTYCEGANVDFDGTDIGEATSAVTKKFYIGTTPPTSLTVTATASGGIPHYCYLKAYCCEIWYEVHTSSTSPSPAAGVVKIGIATKGGSIIATHTVERFHAVVNGYKDPDGNYGGIGTVIARPDYVIKHFLVQKLGFSISTDIDTASFTAAGNLYGTYSYAFAFNVYDTIIPSDFLARLAFECRSTLRYIAGKWYLDVIPDTAPASLKTITAAELAGQFTKFKFNKTPIVDLQNNLTATFKRDYTGLVANNSDWLLTSKTTDTTSEGKYGTYPATLEFEFIRSQTVADSVLDHILLERKNPLLLVTFPIFWEHFDLVEGNTFEIDNLLYDTKIFYIEKISRLDQFRAEIQAKEWWV